MLKCEELYNFIKSYSSYLENNSDSKNKVETFLFYMEDHYKKQNKIPNVPIKVGWGFTSNCNLDCIHCFIDRDNFNPIPYRKLEEYLDVIRKVADAGVKMIAFSGGEPFIYPHFMEMVKFSKQLNLYVDILTNGTLIKKETAFELGQLLDAKTDKIQVSLDSSTSTIFNKQRGRDLYNKVIEGIKLLKQHNIYIRLNFTATHVNVEDMENVYLKAIELGADEINFNPVLPIGNKGRKSRQNLDIERYIANVINVFFRHNQTSTQRRPVLTFSLPVEFFYYLKLCNISIPNHVSKDPNNLKSLYLSEENCRASILSSGAIIPGEYLAYEEFCLGNIYKESLKEIWQRHPFYMRNLQFTVCERCEYFNLCGGGIPGISYEFLGTIHAPDPFCKIYQKDFFLDNNLFLFKLNRRNSSEKNTT